ncbi:MAG: lipoyl synthase [Nitrospinae bacterium]|nr:lipoyl synthase [Nitrospinota bacterium]
MASRRFPPWLVKRLPSPSRSHEVKALMRNKHLHTVCEEARCPNLFECFSRSTATFMIGGDVCTRTCGYCAVTKGMPEPLDVNEPLHVAEAAKDLGLKHVVVTMVNRDDLPDGAAGHVVATIKAIRELLPGTTVEVLVSDFMGDFGAVERVVRAKPDVFNHNIETVRRLFKSTRPNGDYERSLRVIGMAREIDQEMVTKSGVMVGMGETEADVLSLMDDLRDEEVDCQIMTIGQYLSPRKKAIPVREYIHPDVYARYRLAGEARGFAHVFAGPFVRSSYNAEEALHASQGLREGKLQGDPEGRAFMTIDGSGRNVPAPSRRLVSLPVS